MFTKVVEYIEESLNTKLIAKNSSVAFKNNDNKIVCLNNNKKLNLMSTIIDKLVGFDSLKEAFYEKKENIFIISNIRKYILHNKNFYTKKYYMD